MKVLSIDPGPVESGWLVFDTDSFAPLSFGNDTNMDLLEMLVNWSVKYDHLVIEGFASYGSPVGQTTFDACFWSGRLVQAWGKEHTIVYRKEVKKHLLGRVTGNDPAVKQVLIDRFGGVGTKKEPGPLYGIKMHAWSALALAVTWADQQNLRTSLDRVQSKDEVVQLGFLL